MCDIRGQNVSAFSFAKEDLHYLECKMKKEYDIADQFTKLLFLVTMIK